jgi:CDP-diacylglycerol--glycerol-3-phosphate 3-phosphatidyltransferase
MNLPNRLTLARIAAVPVFLILLLWQFPFHYFAALVIFVAASLTDLFDGRIARSRGLITDFGKFLDPIADKMLTTAALLGFISLGIGFGTVWITVIVLIREFSVSSIRMVAAASGKVVAADKWGKIKTVMQMVGIIMALTFEEFISLFPSLLLVGTILRIAYNIVLWFSALLTVVSGINYLVKNKTFVDPNK